MFIANNRHFTCHEHKSFFHNSINYFVLTQFNGPLHDQTSLALSHPHSASFFSLHFYTSPFFFFPLAARSDVNGKRQQRLIRQARVTTGWEEVWRGWERRETRPYPLSSPHPPSSCRTPHEQLGLAGWLGSALETNSLIIEEFFGAANSPDSPRPEVAMDHVTHAHTHAHWVLMLTRM